MSVPKKVFDRIAAGMKRMVPIILQQKTRDVSEADTVTLVKEVLSEILGYDKFLELTGELAIRGTFCDLAIRLDDKFVAIIEVKAIGITLNDRHVKQAVDYATNQGIEWVVLTNAVVWRLYHVIFSKPIDKHLIAEIDLTACDSHSEHDLEVLFAFSKEGFRKGAQVALRDRQDATSRFLVAALILHSENVRYAIRRELRRVVEIMIPDEEIMKVLEKEVIKRDALEGPAAEQAADRVRKTEKRLLRAEQSRPSEGPTEGPCVDETETTPPAPSGSGAPDSTSPNLHM